MKRLLTILACLLLAAPALAFDVACQDGEPWQLARMNPAVLGSGGSAGCSTSTDYVGSKRDSVGHNDRALDYMTCQLVVPTCSGKIYTAYVGHYSTNTDQTKVCIYSDGDSDETPDSSDELIVCSSEIVGDSTNWFSSALTSNPSVSTSSKYWVCNIAGTDGWDLLKTSDKVDTIASKLLAVAGSYASPPANLAGAWSNLGIDLLIYFTIGN